MGQKRWNSVNMIDKKGEPYGKGIQKMHWKKKNSKSRVEFIVKEFLRKGLKGDVSSRVKGSIMRQNNSSIIDNDKL